MSPLFRILFSLFGLACVAKLVWDRGFAIRDSIIAMEFAVFGGAFFAWYMWTGLRDWRRGER